MPDTSYPLESAYKHIRQEMIIPEKPPRYVSKFRKSVLREEKQNKSSMRTMGPAKADVPVPDKFLLKHSKEPWMAEKHDCGEGSHRNCGMRRPAVPLRTDKPQMGAQTKRNFVKTACEDLVHRVPPQVYADTNRGDKHLLENSGLIPKFRKKKDFGQTPKYVQQRMQETQQAKEEHDKQLEEQRQQRAMKQLTEEERRSILEGLKREWTEMTRQYLTLPFNIITFASKDRKDRLERGLKELEADIDLFETHKYICISEDN